MRDNKSKEYEDEDEPVRNVTNIKDTVDANDKFLNQKTMYDNILHYEACIQLVENMTIGKLTKYDIGPDGTVAVTYNK